MDGESEKSACERVIQGLFAPDAYPHPAQQVEHVETHISHVLLAGEHAYKLKKPLALGFLDFSTPERRFHCCEEEIRLNRRLAPDLYLGLVPVLGTREHPRIGAPGDPGRVLEWAVHMRRFCQDGLLDRHPLDATLVDRLAERLAAFHAEIPPAPADSPYGTPKAVLSPMLENFRQVRARVAVAANEERLDRIEAWSLDRWRALLPVIERRRAQGRVRECHGDVHRGNIALVDGEPVIFDALEFSARLRWIDTASELAFLLMDLEQAGEWALAGRLLNRYLEIGGDHEALAMLDLYKVYRAMVRAKVLAIRLGQSGLGADEKRAHRRACQGYLALAEGYMRQRRPRLLIACGLSGSGKSRIGRHLREALPLVHLRSDIERKRLFGLPAEARTTAAEGSGIYFPQATEWTYQRLLQLAGRILDDGYDVLVDATLLTRKRRAAFRALAEARGAELVILAMTAPFEILRSRVIRRLEKNEDVSEASLEVLERQRRILEPLTADEDARAIRIDTSAPPPLTETLERIAALTGIPIETHRISGDPASG